MNGPPTASGKETNVFSWDFTTGGNSSSPFSHDVIKIVRAEMKKSGRKVFLITEIL